MEAKFPEILYLVRQKNKMISYNILAKRGTFMDELVEEDLEVMSQRRSLRNQRMLVIYYCHSRIGVC